MQDRLTSRLPFLPAQAEPLNQGLIPTWIVPAQVIEKPPSLTHDLEKATSGVVVLLVLLEVLRQFVDPLGKERNLDLRRAGVATVGPETVDDRSLPFR